MSADAPANRLATEPSLYLQQHGRNPVDWYPWGSEAIERARAEGKPILLSIGYSACHWCHVMERESFENDDIARLMNDSFVCIKVDREERPDLDNVYMKALQMMTGRGGWPMTVFLTPELQPFYAGTYFPPADRGGMPGFPRVLLGAARAYQEQREKALKTGGRVVELLEQGSAGGDPAGEPSQDDLETAGERLCDVMDADYGGFGSAPKFPGSLCLSFLLGMEAESPRARRAELVRLSLDTMAAGGIYDHLGGGFHRYSVDRYWLVPHFEKMLYDQALLADLYGEGWRMFGEPRYREVALGVLDYVAREMTSAEGAFFSTQDADSEGEEGKFFVWTPDQVRSVVGEDDADLVCRFFDVSEEGNWEGKNILRRTLGYEQVASLFDRDPADVRAVIERAREALFEARRRRVAPATDRKVLADWNGLMIGTMASVGSLLGRDDLVARAARAANFVQEHMTRDGDLLHFWADGEARVDAFLDDYAFFGRASLELFHALGRVEYLDAARRSADALLERFEDRDRGGFFFTARGAEDLIVRSRDLFDGPVPAGNAVAAELLLRLYQITAIDEYRRAGEDTLRAFMGRALENPYGAGHLLAVAHRSLRGYTTVVVAGDSESGVAELLAEVRRRRSPEAAILHAADLQDADRLPELVRGKEPVGGRATAYVCRGTACSAPTTDVEEAAALMHAA